MALDAATMRALEQASARMSTSGHITYLAEALETLKRNMRNPVVAPIESLAILTAMQGSAYAGRPNERAALSDVGQWLEQRLRSQPDILATQLATELGWLKRLARFHDSLSRGADGKRAPPGRGPGPAQQPARFGDSLDALRRLRELRLAPSAPAAAPSPAAKKPAEVRVTAGPTDMPQAVEVSFTDFTREAREAWQVAKKRIKDKKDVKPRTVALTATNAAEVPAGARLVLCMAQTEGVRALFEAIEAAGGRARGFWAAGLAKQDDGTWRAAVVRLERPAE